MATKNKQTETGDKQATETWRKPLQVPPRANAMRSFYRGAEEDQAAESENQVVEKEAANDPEKDERADKIESETPPKSAANKQGREAVKAKPRNAQMPAQRNVEAVPDSGEAEEAAAKAVGAKRLSKEELSEKLGIEIEDLFDIRELLRGKSFDIYQKLIESADETGRCKITQPELMKRTGIKNRRTFYKHEEWLIKLKLLEKRHLPGDHKGVVYKVLEMSEVLPASEKMLEKFKNDLQTGI